MELRPILSALLRSKTGAILVALQVAISLGILANALHVVNVRQSVMSRPSGVADEASVFYLVVKHLPEVSHEEEMATQRRETEILRGVPGVLSVAISNQFPLSNSGNTTGMSLTRGQVEKTASVSFYVTPDSLIKTWGLRLVEGRDFTPDEGLEIDQKTSKANPKVIVISRALAEKAFPGQTSVVGKVLFNGTGDQAQPLTIVGVVERLQSTGAQVSEQGEFSMMTPARLTGNNASMYAMRAAPGQLDRVMKDTEAALRKASALPLLIRSKTMEADRQNRYRADSGLAWMLVAVSVLLLLITASGIVGMTSLRVAQRRKQIGVRRALGARRSDILRYFVSENLMVTGAGVGGGLLLALGLNAMLVGQLEMQRLPEAYLAVGAVMLLLLGLLAALVPAWRGAAISPAMATRSI